MKHQPRSLSWHVVSPILGILVLAGTVAAIAALGPDNGNDAAGRANTSEPLALAGGGQQKDTPKKPAAQDGRVDAAKVMGFGKCVDCHAIVGKGRHKAATGVWMKSKHFKTEEILGTPKAATYAKAMGISKASLRVDSMCVSCHATVQLNAAKKHVAVSGVSCESCHGGASDWLNQHGSYGPKGTKREAETEKNREKRIAHCRKAGMIRTDDLYGLARNCFGCHVISNQDLVNKANHRPRSEFELVGKTRGEVRHNLFMDGEKNADAPSLWSNPVGKPARNATNRRRVMFIVGVLVDLEFAMRNLSRVPAAAGNTGFVKQNKTHAKNQRDLLEGICEALGDNLPPELAEAYEACDAVKISFGAFKDTASAKKAASKLAESAKMVSQKRDGSKLAALDELISEVVILK